MQKMNHEIPIPVRLGLTGGIASGKSRVAELFKKAGIPVVNMDELAREILNESPELQNKIQKLCPAPVLIDGKWDRKKLREFLFGDPELKSSVESVLHPPVRKKFDEACEKAAQEEKKLIVCEAALLIETGYAKKLDGLIVVMAPTSVRKKRLIERDNITPELADRMIASQTNDDARKNAASFIIENTGNRLELEKKVSQLIQSFKGKNWLGQD